LVPARFHAPIQDASATAWAALASDPAKVAAITAAEIAKLTDSEIAAWVPTSMR